jgi:hypothetical protein
MRVEGDWWVPAAARMATSRHRLVYSLRMNVWPNCQVGALPSDAITAQSSYEFGSVCSKCGSCMDYIVSQLGARMHYAVRRESTGRTHPAATGRQVCRGLRQSIPSSM